MAEEKEYYARCPDCDFKETDLEAKRAYSYQDNGCPNCRDNRSVAVSTMDNLQ